MSGDGHTNETRELNLDAIEAQTRHRAQWGDDAHCETVLALVAEVRRLRADNEQGRINLAHYRDIYNDLAGLNARLSEALHEARVTIQASVGQYHPPPGYDSGPLA